MAILPLHEARAQLSKLVESTVATHERIEITRNGRPAAVLMSSDDYEAIQETLEALSDPETMEAVEHARADRKAGRHLTADELGLILQAGNAGTPLSDVEVSLIEEMHAQEVPDEVCMQALRAMLARKRQGAA